MISKHLIKERDINNQWYNRVYILDCMTTTWHLTLRHHQPALEPASLSYDLGQLRVDCEGECWVCQQESGIQVSY